MHGLERISTTITHELPTWVKDKLISRSNTFTHGSGQTLHGGDELKARLEER